MPIRVYKICKFTTYRIGTQVYVGDMKTVKTKTLRTLVFYKQQA